jgi:hypothetical protein
MERPGNRNIDMNTVLVAAFIVGLIVMPNNLGFDHAMAISQSDQTLLKWLLER